MIISFKSFLFEGYEKSCATCISKNLKTGLSIDFTTDCPKRRAGHPCPYCYVEDARKIGFNAKKIVDYTPYNGEIKRLSEKKIKEMNDVGGIRLFSFGDYMSEHDKDIKTLLDDALEVGLKVKAITKQIAFVEKYVSHPAINIINISIDNVGEGIDHEEAKKLKEKYPDKIRIRTVILDPKEIDAEINKDVDVYTLAHGKGLQKAGYKVFTKKEIGEWNKILGGKVCCADGTCKDCKLKCGEVKPKEK